MSEEPTPDATPAPDLAPAPDAAILRGGDPVDPAAPAATPGAGAEFAFSSLVQEDGAFVENWQDQLTEAKPEYEGYRKTLANYRTPLDAIKALGETKALVGRKLDSVETVLNPNPDDPTAMGLYRQALGIPDEGSPEAYEFRMDGELEGKVDQDTLNDFAKKAQEIGLNRKQFAGLVEYQAGIMQDAGTSLEEAMQMQDAQAKTNFWQSAEKELGGKEATDKALDLTVRMLRHGGLDDATISESVAPGIHHMGPQFIKAMAQIASQTSEDKLPSSGTPATQAMDAKAEYKAIIHSSSNPYYEIYHNPMHPDHANVRQKVRDLIKRAG